MLAIWLVQYEGFQMGKVRRNRSGKHADDFKRRLVAESRVEGATVPMVSKRHGVSAGQIYAWRSDGRFDPQSSAVDGFTPVEVADDADTPALSRSVALPAPRIEITLENGRRLSVSDGVDAGFVLELARGLAA